MDRYEFIIAMTSIVMGSGTMAVLFYCGGAPAAAKSAVNGDRVIARVEKHKKGGKTEGSIVRVLKRARQTVVGVYHPTKNYGFVVPEVDLRIPNDFFIPPGEEQGATEGDMVVVRIEDWGDQHRGPVGAVEKILGKRGEPGVELAVDDVVVDAPGAAHREGAEREPKQQIPAPAHPGQRDAPRARPVEQPGADRPVEPHQRGERPQARRKRSTRGSLVGTALS